MIVTLTYGSAAAKRLKNTALGSQPAGDNSHTPGGRLPVVSTRLTVTFPAPEHHHSDRYQIMMTEAHVCEQLAQGHYLAMHWAGIEPGTMGSPVRHAIITSPSHTSEVVLIVFTAFREVSCFARFLL